MTAPYAPQPLAPAWQAAPGRPLAAAIAMFLGGYLLLASLGGQLSTVSMNLFALIMGRPVMIIPEATVALFVLQFVFAIAVVVVGILLTGAPASRRLIATIIVVGGVLLTFVIIGLRLSGVIRIPREAGVVFQSIFSNPWFAVVLLVGVAWLLCRPAVGAGWLVLLATLVLVPVPAMLAFGGVDGGTTQLIMFALSGVVGAAIMLAGRPFRE
jgi:hypothetical protein